MADLFNAFYSKFVLRDLFGKALPGLIFVFLCMILFQGPSRALEVSKESFQMRWSIWILFFGVFWLVGLLIQSLGLAISHLFGFCYDAPNRQAPGEHWELRHRIGMHVQEQNDAVERIIALKDTLQNTFFVLLFSCFVWFFVWFLGEIQALPVSPDSCFVKSKYFWPTFVALSVMTFGAWAQHANLRDIRMPIYLNAIRRVHHFRLGMPREAVDPVVALQWQRLILFVVLLLIWGLLLRPS